MYMRCCIDVARDNDQVTEAVAAAARQAGASVITSLAGEPLPRPLSLFFDSDAFSDFPAR